MLVRLARTFLAGAFACALTAPVAAVAGQHLTVEEIVAHAPVSGSAPTGFTWAPDGSRYVYTVDGARENDAPIVRMHDMRDGSDRVLFAARSSARGSRSRAIGQIVWSPNAHQIAYLNAGDLVVANADGSGDVVLAKEADDPQWSPDNSRIAYVHANDLYVVHVATHRATRVTTGGTATRINGDPDWLYSEELDVDHAYRWAPTGDAIAFLSFDESPVTDFPIQNYLPVHNTVEHQRYPLAGETNPRVSLRVANLRSGSIRTLYDGGPRDEYLLSFTWTPDGREIVDEIIDRAQQHLRIVGFPRDGAASRTIVRESDPHFVDDQPAPIFLHDGHSFIWLSERDGVQGVYRIDARTGAAHRLSGNYAVARVLRVDDAAASIFVDARYPTRRNRTLLRLSLAGGAPLNLTPQIGTHSIDMPQHGDAFIDRFSSHTQPPSITRRTLRGTQVSLFRAPSLARFDLGNSRLLEIPSKWGPLDAAITVPPGFDPGRRYPVIVATYGGPLPASDVLQGDDVWPGLMTHLLAEHGFIVLNLDGPASRFDRASNARLFSHQLGSIAMAGPLAGADWLRAQPYVDVTHLGLVGWSFGGYLTSFTLTHAPHVFRSGISGAPPTDWRFYDTAYTERYMGTPTANPAAYRQSSIIPAAGHLTSPLLLLQGSADDNVHLTNTVALLAAFVQEGKQVDYFVFPGARHGPTGVAAKRYLLTKELDWWERTLK